MHVAMAEPTPADAIIFYTVANSNPPAPSHNGSTATGTTQVYNGSVSVNAGQYREFKAIAYKQGYGDSNVSSFTADNTNPGGQAPQGGTLLDPIATPTPSGPRHVGYVFDDAGNRNNVNETRSGVTVSSKTYTPNNINQYSVADGVTSDAEHSISSYNGVSYSYVNDERLAQVTGSAGTYQLGYDALGRCVRRTMNGVSTVYIYDGEKPILEYNAAGTLIAKNLYGKAIDEIVMRVDSSSTPTQTFYYQHDHEGSVTQITNANGEVIESYRYDAFGAPTVYNGPVQTTEHMIPRSALNNRFLFIGREYAADFAIYEYRARAYNPALGRFTSEDPKLYDAGDYNLFRYCHNDPVDFTDPMGLQALEDQQRNIERQDGDLLSARSWISLDRNLIRVNYRAPESAFKTSKPTLNWQTKVNSKTAPDIVGTKGNRDLATTDANVEVTGGVNEVGGLVQLNVTLTIDVTYATNVTAAESRRAHATEPDHEREIKAIVPALKILAQNIINRDRGVGQLAVNRANNMLKTYVGDVKQASHLDHDQHGVPGHDDHTPTFPGLNGY
jgi:RHS repeat-associated protein